MVEPSFSVGDKVQYIPNTAKIGMIGSLDVTHAGTQFYRVFWGGSSGEQTVSEVDLRLHQEVEKPQDNLRNNNLSGYREFQRIITYQRLLRDYPLQNNIYSFNASRTQLFSYQFKPLLKFLDSPNHRLLIADEVGLGKTIEAGLILTELRARQSLKRILVICPSNLKIKWRLELKRRFGEEFEILDSSKFREFLDEYETYPEGVQLEGIIALETIRHDNIIKRLREFTPSFDLIIVDEAHHLRNFNTKQRNVAEILSPLTGSLIFLTATPVQLGVKNLYSLLNLLDEEDFPDENTFLERYENNMPIVKTQICLGQIPPNLDEAEKLMEEAKSYSLIRKNPLYNVIKTKINQLKNTNLEEATNRKNLIETQRNLAELNLIGFIFTRTRKRDVKHDVPVRDPIAPKITFTDTEQQFYDAVTTFIREELSAKTENPVIVQWVVNNVQRQVSSSIPAMINHFRNKYNLTDAMNLDDYDFDEIDETDNANVISSKQRLLEIISTWTECRQDSKYLKLTEILCGLKREDKNFKIIIFAFYKSTLRYLNEKLKEDGFNSCIIHGDVKPKDRYQIIEEFKKNQNLNIMLSSKVGSEGLDFEFCDSIVNYDLPWNPMEVEQRIGRIDRIGQKSDKIHIYNLWVKGTIEERILRRLYERIGIFTRSVGDLELILGNVIKDLEKNLFTKLLTPEQEKQKTESALNAIENNKKYFEILEEKSAQFIGTDQFFEDDIEKIKKNRRFITGEQLFRFVKDYCDNHCPRTQFSYDDKTLIGRLKPDQILREKIVHYRRRHPGAFEYSRLSAARNITFDQQIAFENPDIEFINVIHPLIMTIKDQYSSETIQPINAQHVILKNEKIKNGFYFYFIFRLRITAARGKNYLETIVLNNELEELSHYSDSEWLMGEMLEMGKESFNAPITVDGDKSQRACSKAMDIFHDRRASIEEEIKKSNDAFVDRRLESIHSHYDKLIKKSEGILEIHEKALSDNADNRIIKIIKLRKGQISNLEDEFRVKKQEIEAKRKIGIEYDEIAAGILEII